MTWRGSCDGDVKGTCSVSVGRRLSTDVPSRGARRAGTGRGRTMHEENAMATDPDTLLSQAMSHALAYRRALAADQRPPSADYHAMLERFTEALPDQGSDAGAVIDALAKQALPGLMPIAG